MKNMDETGAGYLEESIEESIRLMKESYESVYMTAAPDTDKTEKETLVKEMDDCLKTMQAYLQAVNEQKDISGYADKLQSDYYALTAITSTYTQ